jgi:mRNA interferase MazF
MVLQCIRKMQKDFWRWHAKKEVLNNGEGTAFFHEREVWWCALGTNIGFEQDGSGDLFTRPVVIISKFNLDACLVVPLTAKPKKGKYPQLSGQIANRFN